MKIDFIIGTIGYGGAERVLVDLSQHFVLKGHRVAVITYDSSIDRFAVDSNIQRVRLSSKKFPIAKVSNLINLSTYYSRAENRPDLAISFLTPINLVSILACKFKGVPVIVCEHNNHFFVPPPKWLTRLTWRFVYRMAKFVTVLTNFDVPFFKNFKSNVVVMPNPCTFPTITSNSHAREKTILAVGSLDRYHHKGFDTLISIIKPIAKDIPGWKVRVVGGGDNGKTYLEDLVKQNDLDKHFEFYGYSNDVRSIMKNSSIFILPSRYEGLPLVLLEAMSQGMACIAFDCITGPSEMIQTGVNGILIPDQDVAAMQKGLLQLVKDAELRSFLGNNAVESLDAYTIESIYRRWEVLLNDLV